MFLILIISLGGNKVGGDSRVLAEAYEGERWWVKFKEGKTTYEVADLLPCPQSKVTYWKKNMSLREWRG